MAEDLAPPQTPAAVVLFYVFFTGLSKLKYFKPKASKFPFFLAEMKGVCPYSSFGTALEKTHSVL